MFPISDDDSDRRRTPYVNYALILLNVLVFLFLQGAGSNEKFNDTFSCVPQEIITGHDLDEPVTIQNDLTGARTTIDLQPTPVSVYITLLTAMFMHGGFAHIIGNMVYLNVFGDNLEDRMGHGKYLVFYLLCGILAGLAHVFSSMALGGNLLIPSLGASGAISGVLGGYIVLFPARRVTVLAMRTVMHVPAWVCLGIWIVFQLISSAGAFGGDSGGGIAYGAHIGGFVAGLILVSIFASGGQSRVNSRDYYRDRRRY